MKSVTNEYVRVRVQVIYPVCDDICYTALFVGGGGCVALGSGPPPFDDNLRAYIACLHATGHRFRGQ